MNQLQRHAATGIWALTLLAGGIACGSIASQPGQPARQPATITSQPGPPARLPATIENLVLEEGPAPVSTGADYHPIDTRAEEPPGGNTDAFPSHPPDAEPGGFILPWPATSGVARAAGNAADVNAYGHFLTVIWTYSTTGGSPDGSTEQLINAG